MLRFLFPRLTRDGDRGRPLFDALVKRARQPHWYVEGGIEDSIDGRFAVLATLIAMTTVRLEQDAEPGELLSVALSERFVEAMDVEHRELGIGDPTLGKTVRKLMGSLARRVELWRQVAAGSKTWDKAAAASLFRDEPGEGLTHCSEALKRFHEVLQSGSIETLRRGDVA